MLSETDGDLFHRVLDLDNDPDEISQVCLRLSSFTKLRDRNLETVACQSNTSL